MTISLPKFQLPFTDSETTRCAQHARATGRSWWTVRYSWLDDWVHEWDPDPASQNRHRDWPLMPKRGRQALRLYCPNGKFVQVGDTNDATGKLFQLKQGVRSFVIGGIGVGTVETQQTLSQIVGMVHGLDGECVLYAWEPLPPPDVPIDAPKPPREQDWIAKSAEPGLYEKAVAEWERAFAAYCRTPQYMQWQRRYDKWTSNARGRLVGPISDNVYKMTYGNIGKVKAEYLGIDDGE